MNADAPKSGKPWLHVALFFCTLVTTTAAGALQNGVDLFSDPGKIISGLPFAVTLMTILLVHELGHYFMSRYHGVRATLPYFIPVPPQIGDTPLSLIGTFGAFIRIKSPPPDRRSLFDVAAAGPLAGLMLAVPAVIVGFRLSTVGMDKGQGGFTLGSSLLLSFLSRITLGPLPEEANIVMHPIAFAGWIGLLVTAMNLLPVGQLDGGHVAYALFGRRHSWVSRLALVVILSFGFMGWWYGWLIWGVLLLLLGTRHPPPLDPDVPLDPKRRLIGWLMIAILIITFIPAPFSIQESQESEVEEEHIPAQPELPPSEHPGDGIAL